jgi:hypothetical protein
MNGAQREKYWSELEDAEKIERMREEVKKLERVAMSLSNKISKWQRHSHQDNKIVIPLEQDYPPGGITTSRKPLDPDKVYF